jgi:L-ribulose-5-phosphate 3-epimerase
MGRGERRTARVCGIGDEAAQGLCAQLRIHRELGLHGVELRTVDGRGLHELTEDQARAAAEAVAASGLVVPVVDTPVGSWAVTVATDMSGEIEVLRRSAARAALLGCRLLRVMSYPNDGRPERAWRAEALQRMRTLAGVAADLGVTLLHENCQGWAGQGARQTLDMLDGVASPHLRLVFDVGNGLAYGYEAVPFLEAVLPWVAHVHVKDGRRVPGGKPVFGLPGEGEVAIVECLRLLVESGYHGWYSIEPHLHHIPHLQVSGDPERQETGYREYARRFLDLLDDARVARGAVGG